MRSWWRGQRRSVSRDSCRLRLRKTGSTVVRLDRVHLFALLYSPVGFPEQESDDARHTTTRSRQCCGADAIGQSTVSIVVHVNVDGPRQYHQPTCIDSL